MTDEEKAALEAEQNKATEEAEAKAAEEAAKKAEEGNEKTPPKEDDKSKSSMSDAEAKAIKEIMKWKERAKEAENARKELESKYGDVDIEAAREAIRQAEEAENKELERKGEYDRLLKKQREAAEAKIEAERKAREEKEGQVSQLMERINELTVGNSFANSKYIQENLALTPNKTKALYATHFEIEDGNLVAYDAPKGAANRTPIVDASGEPVPFDDALAAIINADPDKDYLIKSNQKPGAGSKPAADGGTEKKPTYSNSLDKLAAGVKNSKNFGYGQSK